MSLSAFFMTHVKKLYNFDIILRSLACAIVPCYSIDNSLLYPCTLQSISTFRLVHRKSSPHGSTRNAGARTVGRIEADLSSSSSTNLEYSSNSASISNWRFDLMSFERRMLARQAIRKIWRSLPEYLSILFLILRMFSIAVSFSFSVIV
jgi:hypothetical protein